MNTQHTASICSCHRRALAGASTHITGFSIAHDSTIPDTSTARAAEAYLAAVSNLTMVRHCMRTYRFGLALATKAGAKPDLETLYIGCLFHDLGLETLFAGPEDFETLGAREAKRFLVQCGSERIAEQVAVAIDVHTALETANDPRPEVAYLSMGAFCDVIGARLDQIEPRIIQQIVDDYPRDGIKALLTALINHQTGSKPGSRIGQVAARIDVIQLIQNAPFAA
jgi:hypothetical protein